MSLVGAKFGLRVDCRMHLSLLMDRLLTVPVSSDGSPIDSTCQFWWIAYWQYLSVLTDRLLTQIASICLRPLLFPPLSLQPLRFAEYFSALWVTFPTFLYAKWCCGPVFKQLVLDISNTFVRWQPSYFSTWYCSSYRNYYDAAVVLQMVFVSMSLEKYRWRLINVLCLVVSVSAAITTQR